MFRFSRVPSGPARAGLSVALAPDSKPPRATCLASRQLRVSPKRCPCSSHWSSVPRLSARPSGRLARGRRKQGKPQPCGRPLSGAANGRRSSLNADARLRRAHCCAAPICCRSGAESNPTAATTTTATETETWIEQGGGQQRRKQIGPLRAGVIQ